MKKASATLTFAVVVLLALLVCRPVFADAPPDNVQGDWTIYSTSIANGETVVKHVQIAQYGNRITGYFEGPDQSGPIQGRVNVHHIVFSTVTRNSPHLPWTDLWRPNVRRLWYSRQACTVAGGASRNDHHGSPPNDGRLSMRLSQSYSPLHRQRPTRRNLLNSQPSATHRRRSQRHSQQATPHRAALHRHLRL